MTAKQWFLAAQDWLRGYVAVVSGRQCFIPWWKGGRFYWAFLWAEYGRAEVNRQYRLMAGDE